MRSRNCTFRCWSVRPALGGHGDKAGTAAARFSPWARARARAKRSWTAAAVLNSCPVRFFSPLPIQASGQSQLSNSRLSTRTGGGHNALSEEIAQYMGVPLTRVQLKRFADGECYVQILETVRGCDVFSIQPTWCAHSPPSCPHVHCTAFARPGRPPIAPLAALTRACPRPPARPCTTT